MVLPSSGQIYLSQVNTELGKATTTAISLGQADVRQLFQVAAGATISLSQGYGKGIQGGPYDQYAVGYHVVTVPWYNTLYVQVFGAGAGGDGGNGRAITSYRYSEGKNQDIPIYTYYSGGDGGAGGASVFYSSTNIIGYGGGRNNVQGTGAGGSYILQGGGRPGGAGGAGEADAGGGVNGGPGGTSAINFYRGNAGAPVPYTQIGLAVGAGGAGGAGSSQGGSAGAAGSGGRVYLSWS